MSLLNRGLVLLLVGIATFQARASQDTLIVGVYHQPPFISKGTSTTFEGLSIGLWENIALEAGIPYRYLEFSDHISILKGLEYQNIDVSINPTPVTPLRAEKFHMTQPYFISSIGVAIPAINRSPIKVFLRNMFSVAFVQIVVLLLLVIFVFGLFLWLAERKVNKFQFRPGIKGLFDGLWWSAVTMTTVGYGDKAPKTNWGKTIAIIWMFTAVIIISSFTAGIATTLTLSSLQTDITGAEDLRLVNSVATVISSNAEEYLIQEEIPVKNLYGSPVLALRSLARQEDDVLLYDRTILQYYINRLHLEDNVKLLPITLKETYQSFMMPKNQPEFNKVNVTLIEEIQKDSWSDLQQKYEVLGR